MVLVNARLVVRGILIVTSMLAALLSNAAIAYERDVHYGLTYWLALKAGFESSQAEAIAMGDQRVDSGGPQIIEVLLDYACLNRNEKAARQYARGHFPSNAAIPAAPSVRVVEPGDEIARRGVADAAVAAKGLESVSLSLFGRALHTLQDSWSQRGIPDTPRPGAGISCDPALASGNPKARGGASSHEADETYLYSADVLDMARATYENLLTYPKVGGQTRSPAEWSTLEPMVLRFAQAKTKTEKHEWFRAQHIDSTGFLQGITLPDGPDPGPLKFVNPLMPRLQSTKSLQQNVSPEAKAFFERFFESWISDATAEEVVAGARASIQRDERDRKSEQLVARLKVWRMKDHGAVAKLANKSSDYTSAELKTIGDLASVAAQIVPTTFGDAFEGLADSSQKASALLPFLLRQLPDGLGGTARMIAMTRLKHAPYDTVGWVAEKSGGEWRLTDVISVVEH
ncbi:DUF6765 family protein [Paraburkholderia youngii]|uniref:DUF6765 family protein n=1 Tax=Paraburkholderia youngii TaxID=2782701 RepID=UPI0015928B18|nr:DUF6765 family protein [Paraburkholderia youngii]NUX57618.1 hypothetical protein [Paraburkholderia youngii]